jgi:hypothetical protein
MTPRCAKPGIRERLLEGATGSRNRRASKWIVRVNEEFRGELPPAREGSEPRR